MLPIPGSLTPLYLSLLLHLHGLTPIHTGVVVTIPGVVDASKSKQSKGVHREPQGLETMSDYKLTPIAVVSVYDLLSLIIT